MKILFEGFMQTVKKSKLVLAVLLLTTLAASCSTTGRYMPLKFGEIVIGTVQETLLVRTSMQNKDAINTEAYTRLLETAGRKYTGNIDIRDIVWVTTGRNVKNDAALTELFVNCKVIQIK